MNVLKDKAEKCVRCDRKFGDVRYHSKNMCQNCYNYTWHLNREKTVKKEKPDHCIKCLCKWGFISEKGKEVKQGSHGMCKMCYQRSYQKTISSKCKRCEREMGKKIKGYCSLCKVELDNMKSPGKRTLPKIDKIKIDRETRESIRRVFNRYKYGLNTLVDPFVVTNLYLDVFSDEVTKGQTASKTEFNLDQFDQEEQVIAMLKLLKMAYDKALV